LVSAQDHVGDVGSKGGEPSPQQDR
jgi:hypothetical protein